MFSIHNRRNSDGELRLSEITLLALQEEKDLRNLNNFPKERRRSRDRRNSCECLDFNKSCSPKNFPKIRIRSPSKSPRRRNSFDHVRVVERVVVQQVPAPIIPIIPIRRRSICVSAPVYLPAPRTEIIAPAYLPTHRYHDNHYGHHYGSNLGLLAANNCNFKRNIVVLK